MYKNTIFAMTLDKEKRTCIILSSTFRKRLKCTLFQCFIATSGRPEGNWKFEVVLGPTNHSPVHHISCWLILEPSTMTKAFHHLPRFTFMASQLSRQGNPLSMQRWWKASDVKQDWFIEDKMTTNGLEWLLIHRRHLSEWHFSNWFQHNSYFHRKYSIFTEN